MMFATATDLIADIARAIDAGCDSSTRYDLTTLVYEWAESTDGGYTIDVETLWTVLPDYLIDADDDDAPSVRCLAQMGGGGNWVEIDIATESDLYGVDREPAAEDHEWSGWSDVRGMVTEYAAAGYLVAIAE